MNEEQRAKRRKILDWIASVGLGGFFLFLLFTLVSLYACGPAEFTTR